VDGRSDLYSLGAMLFQLLTGHLPHQSESMATLMHQITNQPAPDIRRLRPELPESLALIVALALEKRPELRYQRGDLMAQDLEAVLSQIPVELANSTGATPPPPAGQAFERTLRLQSQGAVHNPLPPADPASKT
jgi:serine/threonine-protein kinase